jgi:hypothetical protein
VPPELGEGRTVDGTNLPKPEFRALERAGNAIERRSHVLVERGRKQRPGDRALVDVSSLGESAELLRVRIVELTLTRFGAASAYLTSQIGGAGK